MKIEMGRGQSEREREMEGMREMYRERQIYRPRYREREREKREGVKEETKDININFVGQVTKISEESPTQFTEG